MALLKRANDTVRNSREDAVVADAKDKADEAAAQERDRKRREAERS